MVATVPKQLKSFSNSMTSSFLEAQSNITSLFKCECGASRGPSASAELHVNTLQLEFYIALSSGIVLQSGVGLHCKRN